jgi:hypothetical protein
MRQEDGERDHLRALVEGGSLQKTSEQEHADTPLRARISRPKHAL